MFRCLEVLIVVLLWFLDESSRIRDSIITDLIHATLLSSATRFHSRDAEKNISFHGSKNKGELSKEEYLNPELWISAWPRDFVHLVDGEDFEFKKLLTWISVRMHCRNLNIQWEFCDEIVLCKYMEFRYLFNLKGHSVRIIAYAYNELECYKWHWNKTKRQINAYQTLQKLGIWVNWDVDKTICGFKYLTLNWGTCQNKTTISNSKFYRNSIILYSSNFFMSSSNSQNSSPCWFHYLVFLTLKNWWTLWT